MAERSAFRVAHLPDLLTRNPLHDEPADLGGRLLDLACMARTRIAAAAFKGPRSMLQQVLLPGTNLVRQNLITLRRISRRRKASCSRAAGMTADAVRFEPSIVADHFANDSTSLTINQFLGAVIIKVSGDLQPISPCDNQNR